jgi:methionyl-tRNA synthetase
MPHTKIDDAFASFDEKKAIEAVMGAMRELDAYIQETEPFKVVKTDKEAGVELVREAVERLNTLALLLRPFLPRTAEEILRLIRTHQMPETPLFNRLPE